MEILVQYINGLQRTCWRKNKIGGYFQASLILITNICDISGSWKYAVPVGTKTSPGRPLHVHLGRRDVPNGRLGDVPGT